MFLRERIQCDLLPATKQDGLAHGYSRQGRICCWWARRSQGLRDFRRLPSKLLVTAKMLSSWALWGVLNGEDVFPNKNERALCEKRERICSVSGASQCESTMSLEYWPWKTGRKELRKQKRCCSGSVRRAEWGRSSCGFSECGLECQLGANIFAGKTSKVPRLLLRLITCCLASILIHRAESTFCVTKVRDFSGGYEFLWQVDSPWVGQWMLLWGACALRAILPAKSVLHGECLFFLMWCPSYCPIAHVTYLIVGCIFNQARDESAALSSHRERNGSWRK